MDELKPCPFCGDQPTFWNAREDILLCPCLAGPEVHGTSRENAVEIWNTRADLCADPALLAEAVEVMRITLRFIENTESDFGVKLASGDCARAFLSKLENRHDR